MDNKTALLILMIVLIVFIVLLAALGIVFIIALRKRAPVIKVVMAPLANQQQSSPTAATTEEAPAAQDAKPATETADVEIEPNDADDDDDDDESVTFVTEGLERVRYDRSMTAKLCQLKNETKEWYSALKNDLLSYDKVKGRMSWRRESFRVGRMTVARLVVRGKTLCLLLAVEPSGYSGTKFAVEDVSNVANTADTPTLFRIKSARRLKYAQEMVAGLMKELKVYKNVHYVSEDFFMPYEGDMSLMQRGFVKRIVSGSTRTFKIEEVGEPAMPKDMPKEEKAEAKADLEAAAVKEEADKPAATPKGKKASAATADDKPANKTSKQSTDK